MNIDIMQFIRPEIAVLIPFLMGIGFLLKRHPNFESWRIPFVLYGIGMIITPVYLVVVVRYEDTLAAAVVVGIIQGVLTACSAVGLYEGCKKFKQQGKGSKDESNDKG